MGKRKKRRKRKRAEERAEQARQGHPTDDLSDDDIDDDDDDEEESLGSRFGFGRARQTETKSNEPQYDDKPWWSKDEEFELSDYERNQYGDYKEMPPPLEPEHLRKPEPEKQQTPETTETPITQVATVATQSVGKVVERVKKIDWELIQVQISELQDKIKAGIKRIVEEVQFRNLQMREKVPPRFHIAVYAAIAVVLIGIPLSIGVLLFAGGGANATIEGTAKVTIQSQPNAVNRQPTATAVPQVIIPTSAPVVPATDPPLPSPTLIPATALPTNPPLPTAIPPTTAPLVEATTPPIVAAGSIAPFFAPPVQSWSSDLLRWSQTYGVDAQFMAIVMQLETCGNPLYLGTEGRMGLFAVPGDRFQGEESFINPEDNARRAAELIQQCQAITGNDPGQSYACYRSNTDTTQVDFGLWGEAMQRYFLWGLGMYGDSQSNVPSSAALNDWLVNGGGFDVCNQAQSTLDSQ